MGRMQSEGLFLYILIEMTKEKVGWVLGIGESAIEVLRNEVMGCN